MRDVEYKGKRYTVSEAHPAADAMPWNLDDAEFGGLVASMRDDGFDADRPVTKILGTNLIADGRRRELAAVIAGVEPIYRTVSWDDEQVVKWVERDLTRRNLSASQRAAAGVELASLMSRGRPTEKGQRCPLSLTAAEIAAKHDTGEKTVDAAAKVKKADSALFAAVKEGELPAHTAAKIAGLSKAERAKVTKAKDKKAAAKKALAKAKPPKPKGEPAAEPVAREQPETFPLVSPTEAAPVAPEQESDPGAEFVTAVETLCRDTDQIAARMRALKASPFAHSIHIDSAVSQVEAARKTLWQGRPAHPCPYCKDEPAPTCKACRGTGRVKKTAFDAGKEAMGDAA